MIAPDLTDCQVASWKFLEYVGWKLEGGIICPTYYVKCMSCGATIPKFTWNPTKPLVMKYCTCLTKKAKK